MASRTVDQSFVRLLRQALRHLYDPVELRQNPLFRLLGFDEHASPSALRRALVDAIEALKPAPELSLQSNPWRTYQVLSHRYVQQFSQPEVATNLGFGIRQLRRQEQLALRALADFLWNHYNLASKAGDGLAQESAPPSPAGSEEHELAWLQRSFESQPAPVAQIVEATLRTAGPLTRAAGVRVEWELPKGLPHVEVQMAAVPQALLSILTAAVRAAPAGPIRIAAQPHGDEVWISVDATSGKLGDTLAAEDAECLAMARRLAALSGGSLDVDGGCAEGEFRVTLKLPAAQQATVLVIDDNADTLQLLERYLAGTRYSVVGARDPDQALELAKKLTLQAIVLDVMLPGMDGWELLGWLREHPRARGVPVIVCTILPQEQVALSLGAAAFLRKPVSRTDLLSALDRVSGSSEQGSG